MNVPRFIFARLASGVFAFLGYVLAAVIVLAADSPPPEVSISLRGLLNAAIETGEPFRVAVRVDAPENTTAKLELAPASGSWIDATMVELLTADGQSVSAQARPAPQTARQITVVDEENPATGLWWFPPASLQSVGPGDYVVRARLRIRDGSGWKGDVVSEPANLRVLPQSNDLERVSQRRIAQAQAAVLAGEPAKAGEILNAMLDAEPDNVAALVLHAALSLEGGNRTAAQVCINRALMLSNRAGEEPSAELNELALRIDGSTSQSASTGQVPTWTQIPRVLFEPVRIAQQKSADSRPTVSPVRVEPTPVAVAPAKPANPSASHTVAGTSAIPISSEKFEGVIVAALKLSDAIVTADSAGQWAVNATAGSQYDKKQYAALQATGAPNISVAGNSPDAWCPAKKNDGTDWLEVSFAKPVHATEVRIRQNDAPGCISKIEVSEPDGTAHVWWEGVDPYVPPPTREIVWFGVRVPKTTYLVAKLKITLNLATVSGWKEIDAVQLIGGD